MRYQQSQQGFSLVETLVAITILLLVIVGPMTISSQSAKSTSFASEQVIAFFLAQEGAELIQKGRDDLFNLYFLPLGHPSRLANPWATFTNESGFYGPCYRPDGCGVEILRTAVGGLQLKDCTGNGCPLFFDDNVASTLRSRYTYTNLGVNLSTPYSRVINMKRISANEVRIISTVTWRSGNLRDEQSASVETYLFNTYADK